MKFFVIFLIMLIFASCSNTNKTFWCGDHPCINKKEKKAYFKKYKTLEVKEINKKNKEEISNFQKIMDQAKKDQKKKIRDDKKIQKAKKLKEKNELKEQKRLTKKVRLEQKRKLNEQKKLKKHAKLQEKKANKKIISHNKNKKIIKTVDYKANLSEYEKIVIRIKEKNMSKKYPNINYIPN